MQTVCERSVYTARPAGRTELRPKSAAELKIPAHERRLALQIFFGGLAVSGLILAAAHVLGF